VSEIFARLPLESCFTLFRIAQIIIAVGSKRGPKLNAVTEALQSFSSALGHDSDSKRRLEVESGGQPYAASRDELMPGAASAPKLLLKWPRESGASWKYFGRSEGGLDVVHEGASTARGAAAFRNCRPKMGIAASSWKAGLMFPMACEVITAVREASRSPQHWPAKSRKWRRACLSDRPLRRRRGHPRRARRLGVLSTNSLRARKLFVLP